ncbi:MAG: ankyrin repeat domain-containing protein [Akkermansiaceae bacterium]|nr:ankyrin repeat domain-containing protein [Akkermansiaceae bacterium]
MKPNTPCPRTELSPRDAMRHHRPTASFIVPGLTLAIGAALIFGVSAGAAEIHDAVRKGDAAAVTRLLKKSPKSVNLVDEEKGVTPLYEAVDAGNLELVQILLKAKAKVNVKTDDGMTPVLRAAAIANPQGMSGLRKVLVSYIGSGPGGVKEESRKALKSFQQSAFLRPEEEESRLAILRLLVEQGGSVSDTLPPTGGTPLYCAVCCSNPKAVEYLLAHGADQEASCLGMRPLHAALLIDSPEIVKLLIAHKAEVVAAGPNGMRPLHFAVGGDIESVRLLLDRGAEVNAVDKSGAPALHGATWSDDIFDLLLQRGADPKLERSDGTTTLHRACHDGSEALVAKLLKLQPDLEARDGSFFTPLLNASEVGRLDLMQLLVKAGASLRPVEQAGRNALFLAAGSDNPEAVRFLLGHKLGVDAMSDLRETALMNAASRGRLQAVSLLVAAGAKVNGAETELGLTALMGAAIGGRMSPADLRAGTQSLGNCGPIADYPQIATLLLDKGADLRAKDRTGKTALHWAAAVGNVAVLELLIARGADIEANETPLGRTPLHFAAYGADAKTVAALVAKGASMAAKDATGLQPIHFAAQLGDAEILEFLIGKGADVTMTESHGATPLHLAVIAGQPKAVRALLSHEAPPTSLDHYMRSPLHFAAEHGSVEIVRLLLDHRAPVNGADIRGDTPLHLAALLRINRNDIKGTPGGLADPGTGAALAAINNSNPAAKLQIAKLLLAKGAKPQIKNRQGATPVDVAAKFATPEILAALKSAKPPSSGK